MHPNASVLVRFWAKVDVRGPDECWLWTGGERNGNGYGGYWLKPEGKFLLAHRYAFYLANGRWPNEARHSCDNRRCVNPAHIIDGTHAENMADMRRRGRARGKVLLGGENGNAVLSADSVTVIRAALRGGVAKAMIARAFGVDLKTIHGIARRDTWDHLP